MRKLLSHDADEDHQAGRLGRVAEVLPSPEHFLFVEYREEGLRIPLFPDLFAATGDNNA